MNLGQKRYAVGRVSEILAKKLETKKHNLPVEVLKKEAKKIQDHIMLGDSESTIKIIRNFEKF